MREQERWFANQQLFELADTGRGPDVSIVANGRSN
jgi:hypothetical protein